MTGTIYSIGHGGRTFSELAEQVAAQGVKFLIDVRSVPYSKYQPDFTKDALERALSAVRLKYVFMGDLLGGRPADDDCYTEGRVDYAKCRTKDFFLRGLGRLRSAHVQGFCVSLLCSEAQPASCHRSKLVGAALADEGIIVRHLLPNGSVRLQEDVMREITGNQAGLFGTQMMSRNVYR